jgi:hypothetical protein
MGFYQVLLGHLGSRSTRWVDWFSPGQLQARVFNKTDPVLLSNFDLFFYKPKLTKTQKNKNPKKYILYIFASFLVFLVLS